MKKTLTLFLAIIMACTFAACENFIEEMLINESIGTDDLADVSNKVGISNSDTSSAVESVTESDYFSDSETTSVDDNEPSENARLVKILRSDFPIYDGPSYDNYSIGTVEIAGSYTIIETAYDSEGNLWGKLKSGAGWVDLSLIESESNNMPLVTVARASEKLLNSQNYHYCQADSSHYAYEISISAHNALLDVSFFLIDATDDYIRQPNLFHVSMLDTSKPLVASVSFPGIATMYGLEFTDPSGTTRIYIINESGRNGDVYITPFDGILHPVELEVAPWKTAYLNYIESLGTEKTYSEYTLVYIDSDDIPELFISGSCEASGCTVCSYKSGKVADTYLNRLGGASYIPRQGLVYNFNGNMGYYTVTIYSLSDCGFELLFSATQEESCYINEDGEYECTYYINLDNTKVEVTEEEF